MDCMEKSNHLMTLQENRGVYSKMSSAAFTSSLFLLYSKRFEKFNDAFSLFSLIWGTIIKSWSGELESVAASILIRENVLKFLEKFSGEKFFFRFRWRLIKLLKIYYDSMNFKKIDEAFINIGFAFNAVLCSEVIDKDFGV